MAKFVRFTGDQNTGLARFSVYDSVGDYDAAKEPIDESIQITKHLEKEFVIPAGTTDYVISLSEVAPTLKVLLRLSAAANVKIGSSGATPMLLSGTSVFGGAISQFLVTTVGTQVVARVIAGG